MAARPHAVSRADFDDDEDDDEPPPPPPEGHEGIFDPDEAPPPPPEGHQGIWSGARHAPASFLPNASASAGTARPGSEGKKGSARAWAEQKLAEQKRRTTNADPSSSLPSSLPTGEFDDDDSDDSGDEDAAFYRHERQDARRIAEKGDDYGLSSDDEGGGGGGGGGGRFPGFPGGGRTASVPQGSEQLRMQMQNAALNRVKAVPSGAKGISDVVAALRSAPEAGMPPLPAFGHRVSKPANPMLGRWGTGGSSAVESPGTAKKSMWGSLRQVVSKPELLQQASEGAIGDEAPAAAAEAAAEAAPGVAKTAAELAAELEASEEASGVPPVSREGALKAYLYKRGGLKSRAWKKRYCVYEPKTGAFTYYADEKSAAADEKRKGRTIVTQSAPINKATARARVERRLSKATEAGSRAAADAQAEAEAAAVATSVKNSMHAGLSEEALKVAAKEGKFEFKFNTTEGRVYECYTELATEYRAWLKAMPHWSETLTMGWLYKRKHGSKKSSFDRRYAIFDPETKIFSYYASEHDAKMNRERKGAVEVASTTLDQNPIPSPAPSPIPSPIPNPESNPEPNPEPNPKPSPEPSPEPNPEPWPRPWPWPRPRPRSRPWPRS